MFLEKIAHEYQADGAAKELSSHIQSLWDRYLTSSLDQHPFNRGNVDIAGLLFFPGIWDQRRSIILRSSQISAILLRGPQQYQDLLREFFEDKNRSGRYHLDGTVYAHTALAYFQTMINPNAE